MCFIITTPEKIAKKDIVCWKPLIKLSPKAKNDYRSIYYRSLYKLKRIYAVKKFGIDGDCIDEGLHSYSNLYKAKDRLYIGVDKKTTVKCVIPKGTKYYYNRDYKEYVSLAIKLIKEI